MTGPTPAGTPEPTPVETPPTPADNPQLVPLAEAAKIAGVTVGALRKRYQGGDLERHYDQAGRVLLDLEAVRRLYHGQDPTLVGREKEREPDTPAGSILVPLEAWQQVLAQLGNLHQAGQDLAEARERAARAEERETFAQERRREAEARARDLEAQLDAGKKPAEIDTFPPLKPRRWWQWGTG